MPYRSTTFFWAVFGSMLVLGLILLGRDLHRAARTGPGWKRRLVAAGLVLLAAFGFTAGCGDAISADDGGPPASADSGDAVPPGTRLEEAPQWKHLIAVWREAEQIGSGRRGNYPFDRAGKEKIQADLATVQSDLGRLRETGLLSEPEAGLLGKELSLLCSRVAAMRPTEMKMATCYKPMPFTPARDSLTRLVDRLPLLEELAGSETVHPEVLAKVLDTVDRDVAVLGQQQMIEQLPEDQRSVAKETARKAQAKVEQVRGRLDKPSPGDK